jgi:hypothetical protein
LNIAPAAFEAFLIANVIKQNTAHHASGDPEEVRAVLPRDPVLIDQPNIGLINKRGSLQGITRADAPHLLVGHPVKLFFDQGNKLPEGFVIAVSPIDQ